MTEFKINLEDIILIRDASYVFQSLANAFNSRGEDHNLEVVTVQRERLESLINRIVDKDMNYVGI